MGGREPGPLHGYTRGEGWKGGSQGQPMVIKGGEPGSSQCYTKRVGALEREGARANSELNRGRGGVRMEVVRANSAV